MLESFNSSETIEQPDCFVLLVQDMERSVEFCGVTCTRSTLLFCGLCFQAFVCVSLNVCLCIPHESIYLAQNSETVKRCTSILLVYLMLLNVVTNRIESSRLRVVLFYEKKLSAFFLPQRCSVHNRDGVMFLDYNNKTVSVEKMST